jgi:hypothetical protein
MNRVPRTRVAHAFRRTALPLASYYAVTLAVPLANGAAQSGAFVEHALAVLVVPPVAIILACTVHTIAHALASACRAAGASRRCCRQLKCDSLPAILLHKAAPTATPRPSSRRCEEEPWAQPQRQVVR